MKWIVGSLAFVTALTVFAGWLFLSSARQPIENPPADADGVCPTFVPQYDTCDVRFGNRGLSVLNSFYETFVGQGAFEIDAFSVESEGADRFTIRAQSNRGELISEIIADRRVRLGQDLENEQLTLTNQSSYCDAGTIYERQVGFLPGGKINVQDLEFRSKGNRLIFTLYQDRKLTAKVVCEATASG